MVAVPIGLSFRLERQRAAARADIYNVLAACFAPPREYARLCEGPGEALVPLYESSYVDDFPTPDHLSAELAFVASISEREARDRANGDIAAADEAAHVRQAFMAAHLRRWAPSVARLTLARAHHPLYVAAASLLWSVMEVDHS
jgi:TorA maturation chaperone TorD